MTLSGTVELNAGLQTLRFEALSGAININWFKFTEAEATEIIDGVNLKAYHFWDCGSYAYSGAATASGCDSNANPGRFEITTQGTYYLLFRSGGNTYGTSSVVLDNWTLEAVE